MGDIRVSKETTFTVTIEIDQQELDDLYRLTGEHDNMLPNGHPFFRQVATELSRHASAGVTPRGEMPF